MAVAGPIPIFHLFFIHHLDMAQQFDRRRVNGPEDSAAPVFSEDEVWENIQESRLRQKEAKEVESKERKVCSLDTLNIHNCSPTMDV